MIIYVQQPFYEKTTRGNVSFGRLHEQLEIEIPKTKSFTIASRRWNT